LKPALLDANLLIALLWPSHEHHDLAHRWFGARRERRWATCPLTELAFVRIVSNPTFSKEALSPANAVSLLGHNLSRAGHRAWPDDVNVVEALAPSASRLQGHRQLTDMYLLSLAFRRKGVLATFDARLRGLATGDLSASLEVVDVAARPSRSR
jgi:toxin-antitoxin system PIN domain toxin